jgi:hypothetical protein
MGQRHVLSALGGTQDVDFGAVEFVDPLRGDFRLKTGTAQANREGGGRTGSGS